MKESTERIIGIIVGYVMAAFIYGATVWMLVRMAAER